MATLTLKDERKILFSAIRLYGKKSLLVPKSISDIPTKRYFERELRLRDNRSIYLTDSGYEHFLTVVNILDRTDFFDGAANYSDIWNAWHRVLEEWLSNRVEPESANEVVQTIADHINQHIDDHTFVVPLFGVELEGANSFSLGAMTILRMSVDTLDSEGVDHAHTDIPRLLELNKNYLWLKGMTHGTPKVAQQRFSELATQMVGMLSIAAASMYEGGASGFRIGIIMSSEESVGRSAWVSWREGDRSITTHYASPKGQPFPINKDLQVESDLVRMINRSFAILQSSNRTQLEEAIAKAVYWYSDAQRDPVVVMKLVKYWSCVEAFFSFENEEITHAVSAGLTSILVYGGFRFLPPSEYSSLKRKIVDLYGLRSQAVHRGSHQHTTEHDVAQFSQWVAWMIISMVVLVEQGYTNLKQVKEQTDRLDGLEKRMEDVTAR